MPGVSAVIEFLDEGLLVDNSTSPDGPMTLNMMSGGPVKPCAVSTRAPIAPPKLSPPTVKLYSRVSSLFTRMFIGWALPAETQTCDLFQGISMVGMTAGVTPGVGVCPLETSTVGSALSTQAVSVEAAMNRAPVRTTSRPKRLKFANAEHARMDG